MIKQITPEIAKELLENKEACLIDVREKYEHDNQSIKGSVLIPLDEIASNKIPQNYKDKKIIIHCQKGGRASKACEKLLEENPNLDIYNLEGGILNWTNCGNQTICKNEGKKTMSIERQVRLSAGLLVFIGAILSFVNFNFIAIPLIIGFGLVFTAIIDWCGMAKILMKMPWNK